MISALRDQFPLAFFSFFLSGFLPWIMDWKYLDAPILATHALAALFLVHGFVAEHGAEKAARYGFLWGLILMLGGIGLLNAFDRPARLLHPPVSLLAATLVMLACAARLVAAIAAGAHAHRARWAAIALVASAYWISNQLLSNFAVVLFFSFLAALCGAAAWGLLRWPKSSSE